jgi:hypothetical protein
MRLNKNAVGPYPYVVFATLSFYTFRKSRVEVLCIIEDDINVGYNHYRDHLITVFFSK